MKRKYKRRWLDYSTKRKMRIRLMLKVLAIAVISVAVTSILFYLYSNIKIEGVTYREFHIHAKNFLDYLIPIVIGAFGISIIIAIIASLFFPNPIAGPLYRIERDLRDKIGEGDLTIRFNLRKYDDVKDLGESINIMVEKLREKITNIKSISDEMGELITLKHNEGGFVDDLIEINKRLGEGISRFKLL
ncbi:MAG: methyl-accepting chemotaxis protein [Nitrospinae bacterium]|nr:methyl-accepting chemotaxis protein [Nitrospinota bacterium]